MTDHENRMIICVGIGAVINLMGNSLLIPRYQEFGAAIASIISEIAVMVVYVQFGKKYYQLIGVGRSAVKVVLAVTVMAGYLLLCAQLPLSPWTVLALQVIGAIAVYFGMLLLLKEEITLYYYRQVIGTVKQRKKDTVALPGPWRIRPLFYQYKKDRRPDEASGDRRPGPGGRYSLR